MFHVDISGLIFLALVGVETFLLLHFGGEFASFFSLLRADHVETFRLELLILVRWAFVVRLVCSGLTLRHEGEEETWIKRAV